MNMCASPSLHGIQLTMDHEVSLEQPLLRLAFPQGKAVSQQPGSDAGTKPISAQDADLAHEAALMGVAKREKVGRADLRMSVYPNNTQTMHVWNSSCIYYEYYIYIIYICMILCNILYALRYGQKCM